MKQRQRTLRNARRSLRTGEVQRCRPPGSNAGVRLSPAALWGEASGGGAEPERQRLGGLTLRGHAIGPATAVLLPPHITSFFSRWLTLTAKHLLISQANYSARRRPGLPQAPGSLSRLAPGAAHREVRRPQRNGSP